MWRFFIPRESSWQTHWFVWRVHIFRSMVRQTMVSVRPFTYAILTKMAWNCTGIALKTSGHGLSMVHCRCSRIRLISIICLLRPSLEAVVRVVEVAQGKSGPFLGMSDSVAVAKPVVSEPLVSRLPVFRHGLGSFAEPRGIARHLLNITGGEIFYGIWRWLPSGRISFFC